MGTPQQKDHPPPLARISEQSLTEVNLQIVRPLHIQWHQGEWGTEFKIDYFGSIPERTFLRSSGITSGPPEALTSPPPQH